MSGEEAEAAGPHSRSPYRLTGASRAGRPRRRKIPSRSKRTTWFVSKCPSGLSPPVDLTHLYPHGACLRLRCLPRDACMLAACRTGLAESVPEPSPKGLGVLAHVCVQPRPGPAFGDGTFARVLQPSWDTLPELPRTHLCWRGQRGV